MFELPMLPRSREAACRDLSNPRPEVRVAAIADLVRSTGETELESSLSYLKAALLDREVSVIRAALLGLADLGQHGPLGEITALLKHPDASVRAFAILALGELGTREPDEAANAIAPFLGATDVRVRYQALTAMARLRPRSALLGLYEALHEPDAELVDVALRMLDEGVELGRFEKDARLRAEILEATRRGTERNQALAERVALDLGFDTETGALKKLLFGAIRPREPGDLERALEAAGRSRRKELTKALEWRAFGRFGISWDPFRYLARAALLVMGHERARKAVLRELQRTRGVGRAATISGLGQVRALEMAEAIAEAARADASLRDVAEQALAQLGPRSPNAESD